MCVLNLLGPILSTNEMEKTVISRDGQVQDTA